ncbi:MAG: heme exporter protein CcmD [Alphaproteobacteria bacterium]
MDNVTAFLEMGGYAPFVWPALGLTAVVLVGMLVGSIHSLRTGEAALMELERAGGSARPRRQADRSDNET